MKKISIVLADHLYSIAARNAKELGVERYLEQVLAEHLYNETPKVPTKETTGNPVSFRTSKEGLPDTVLQIYAIVRHMREEKLSFKKAVKVTANELGIRESTVRDKCTRRITISSTEIINTDAFNELWQKPEKLVNHLCQKFPDHRQAIVEKFKPFTT